MQALLEVVLPVFLLIGAGYAAVWSRILGDADIDGLMRFTQTIAIPCLLFLAIATLDLGQSFDLTMLGSFYVGALTGFGLGLAGARWLFGRPWEDAVVIGFVCLFSNSVMLGLPITERAYGSAALASNFAIVAVHAPICYLVGITAMEVVLNRGRGALSAMRRVLGGMARNALMIGIALGFAVNLSGLPLPGVARGALDMMVAAALPAALFGLGGVLFRYRPEGDLRTIAYCCAVSLLVHPAVTFGLGSGLGLSDGQMRSAVVTAAMAPGVNGYIFANLYGRAKRVAASTVLLGTALTVLTTSGWLLLLP